MKVAIDRALWIRRGSEAIFKGAVQDFIISFWYIGGCQSWLRCRVTRGAERWKGSGRINTNIYILAEEVAGTPVSFSVVSRTSTPASLMRTIVALALHVFTAGLIPVQYVRRFFHTESTRKAVHFVSGAKVSLSIEARAPTLANHVVHVKEYHQRYQRLAVDPSLLSYSRTSRFRTDHL